MKNKSACLLACALLSCASAHAASEQQIAAPCSPGVSFWSLPGSVGVGYVDHTRWRLSDSLQVNPS